MSLVLTKAGVFQLRLHGFNARALHEATGILFPSAQPQLPWQSGDWLLVFEADPEATPPTPEEVLATERSEMEVSRLQALIILQTTGLLPQIKTYMEDPNVNLITKLAWDNALTFRRMSPMVIEIGTLFNLTDVQLDDLFRQAATIVV